MEMLNTTYANRNAVSHVAGNNAAIVISTSHIRGDTVITSNFEFVINGNVIKAFDTTAEFTGKVSSKKVNSVHDEVLFKYHDMITEFYNTHIA